jgi:hypothetical protein
LNKPSGIGGPPELGGRRGQFQMAGATRIEADDAETSPRETIVA